MQVVSVQKIRLTVKCLAQAMFLQTGIAAINGRLGKNRANNSHQLANDNTENKF